jgi:hypothetical protein
VGEGLGHFVVDVGVVDVVDVVGVDLIGIEYVVVDAVVDVVVGVGIAVDFVDVGVVVDCAVVGLVMVEQYQGFDPIGIVASGFEGQHLKREVEVGVGG